MQTHIKFCGMTRQQDIQLAVTLGVDALGFVFVKDSERNIDINTAVNLIGDVPPFIIKVGLFMDAHVAEVKNGKMEGSIIYMYNKELKQAKQQLSKTFDRALKPRYSGGNSSNLRSV